MQRQRFVLMLLRKIVDVEESTEWIQTQPRVNLSPRLPLGC